MFIPDPDFYPSRIPDPWIPDPWIPDPWIPDPKTATEERSEKKFCCHTFLCSHKFHKIENYFSFDVLKKKIRANFQRIIELFTQKIVTKLSKIWVWDPGSRIQGQKGTGSRIPDLDPQHCFFPFFWDQFGLPRSGSRFPIRIRKRSGPETLNAQNPNLEGYNWSLDESNFLSLGFYTGQHASPEGRGRCKII
jgi:hypothetical protein